MTTISSPVLVASPFATPTKPFQRFKRHPVGFAVRLLYAHRHVPLPPRPLDSPIKVVCISDTHNHTPEVPDGDVLVHSGDLTSKGTFEELQAQLNWLNSLPHTHKFVIGGNHDLLLDDNYVDETPWRIQVDEGATRADLDWGSLVYLENTTSTIHILGREIKVFGCPLTPDCGSWAFQYPPIRNVWRGTIPENIDIVLAHGPPKGHLDSYDEVKRGCGWLTKELWRVKPKLVVFGHIHAARGREDLTWDQVQNVYDRAMTADANIFGVAWMAIALLVEKVRHFVTQKGVEAKTILINAAISQEQSAFDITVLKI